MADDLIRSLRNHALPDPYDEREVMHAPLLREAADELARLRAEVARLTEVSEAWQRGFAERGVQLERLTERADMAEMAVARLIGEALRASVSLLEEQHQRDWAERERQSTQLLHLSDQVEALRADAARLDAIEGNLWFVEPRYQYEPAQFGVGKADTMKVAKTLRAAIDAARSAT